MHPTYNPLYHNFNGRLNPYSEQGHNYGWGINDSLTLSGGNDSVQEHAGNPPSYYSYSSHQFSDRDCLLVASEHYVQLDDIPLWQVSLGSNAMAAQDGPGHVIQMASLHLDPSKLTSTSVDLGLDLPHGLFDLHNISSTSPSVSQLTLQNPHGPGYHCTLAQCTSPYKTFASIADVIEHIRTEDAVMSRPQGVWCSCNKWFSSKQVGQRHVRSLNGGKQHPCPYCSMRFKRLDEVTAHVRARHLSSPRKIVRTNTKKRIAKRKPSSHDV